MCPSSHSLEKIYRTSSRFLRSGSMKKDNKNKIFLGNDRTFANAFKYFRKQAGLTQTEAAELTELSQSAISRFEDGDNWPCKELHFASATYTVSLLVSCLILLLKTFAIYLLGHWK